MTPNSDEKNCILAIDGGCIECKDTDRCKVDSIPTLTKRLEDAHE